MQFDEAYYASVYGNYAKQNPARKLRFYRTLLERHVNGAAPRVLDLGCAFGLFLASLDARYRRYGVDASAYAVRQAAARTPEARFAVGDCAAPPFAGPFDAIVAFDVLEHIPDLEGTLDFIASSLAPGGVLIFVVPVYDGPLGPIVRLLDHDPTHVHKHGRRWWLDRIASRFEVLEWTGILRYLIPPGYYLHAPSRQIRTFSPAIAVAARCYTRLKPC